MSTSSRAETGVAEAPVDAGARAVSRLSLGTAAFGLAYGVTDPTARERTSRPIDDDACAALLERAWQAGIRRLDTAPAYGDAERKLAGRVDGFQIVTKVPAVQNAGATAWGELLGQRAGDWLLRGVAGTLERLGCDALHGLLLHRAGDLREHPALREALAAVVARGWVQHIGLSIYEAADLDVLDDDVGASPFSLVQLPFSIVDQRLQRDGTLARLTAARIEVHARSIFLQGALLLPPEQLPPHLQALAAGQRRLVTALAASGANMLEACLAAALGRPELAAVVVGIHDLAQLDALVAATTRVGPQSEALTATLEPFACDDVATLDPRRWPAIQSAAGAAASEPADVTGAEVSR